MAEMGWTARAGVDVRRGTWQVALPALLAEAAAGGGAARFNAVFYDTHDEGVPAFLRAARAAAQILSPQDGTFSFWNGST